MAWMIFWTLVATFGAAVFLAAAVEVMLRLIAGPPASSEVKSARYVRGASPRKRAGGSGTR